MEVNFRNFYNTFSIQVIIIKCMLLMIYSESIDYILCLYFMKVLCNQIPTAYKPHRIALQLDRAFI